MGLFETFDSVSHQDWLDKITTDLKGKDFDETLVWKTKEGIDIQPFYTSCPDNFTPSPLKSAADWKIRETITITSVENANKKALLALKGGANSLLFVGEIHSQNEMDVLLKDIQIDIIEVHFYTTNPKQTTSFVNLTDGSISYDFLGEKLENIEKQVDYIVASMTSKTKTITVNGKSFSDKGASVIDELAFTLAQGVEYLNLLTEKGIDAQTIANKMQFNLGIGTNYFFEIAKIRAIRILWNTILEQYKVANSAMYIHSETNRTEEGQEDKNYDILRNTTRAMSAIIGGCNSLSVCPHDNSEANQDFSNRIARNIQHILKEEAFFGKVNNPADGSYYIEELTTEIAAKSWKVFQEIESQGGFIASIKSNFISTKIHQNSIA